MGFNQVGAPPSLTSPSSHPQELTEASRIMGYAAVKYADLKNHRLTNYKFNFDDMLALKGNTAVYQLYAHARIAGIVRKSGKDVQGARTWSGAGEEKRGGTPSRTQVQTLHRETLLPCCCNMCARCWYGDVQIEGVVKVRV